MKFLRALSPSRSRRSLRCHESAGDRVAAVQREVGLVGAHLVSVVGEVDASVGEERLERRVGEQPPADVVVRPAVGEQQPVGGLVAEDVEQAVAAAHQQRTPRARPTSVSIDDRGGDDTERLRQRAPTTVSTLRSVGMRRSSSRSGRTAIARCVEPVGRQHVGQRVEPAAPSCGGAIGEQDGGRSGGGGTRLRRR